ncbi:Ionotropic glutamate receptor [Trema orientale]|uniref:Glutamate receptor n=1 Tax=Trema orientale TaxID=63057 RepID=A0A2P5EVA7_TREOI|nr:Ionotropic glutamate receptor [Trema orientale]
MKKSTTIFFSLHGILLLVCLGGGPILFLSNLATGAQNSSKAVPVRVNVGVVVDYDHRLVGTMGLRCIRMALSDFYVSNPNYNTRLALHTRDSNSDVVGAAAAALDLIRNVEVQAIIGPITSTQANFVVDLGEKAKVPIISYSATSPTLTRSSYFFRATENQESQVKAITSIVEAFGWKQVVPIYSNNEYGEGLIPLLTDALLEVNAHVPYRSVIPMSASVEQIGEELHNLMTKQTTRVFIVHTNVSLGSLIFTKAKEIGMMKQGYVWIMTNVMTNLIGSMNSSVVHSMNGVLGIKTYVPESKGFRDFRARWKREFRNEELNVFGLWAYDAAQALAMAIEEVGHNGNFGFDKSNNASANSTDLETFGVSLNGPKLHEALSDLRFKGLAGNFSLVNRELQSSTYQIINVVNGDGENGVGFWTSENGLVRNLRNSTRTTSAKYSTSKENLGPIMWPGESRYFPKGWEIPINGKKLRVGVPLRGGFKEFVDVTFNPSNNTPNVTGYCIEIFEAVMKKLPYSVDYEFIPFVNSSHESNGTYDDLVYQVYLGNFDAVVGDTTIRANRSLYVDFTLPYTESGVQMIVPIKDKRNKNAWVFLKPLTWDLWVTSACFFVFIGFVIWVLEHRINKDFRGPPLHQIGTSLWFSFSTMVFAHRERVISNLARFVVIIWVFVVLILTQSYTASLTSLLTVQQLQPTVTNINQLLKNGDNVGYLEASFVYGMLKSLGFNDSQLKMYKSPEELENAFSNYKSSREGIAAAFDETPYMRLFLARYCSKYTMVDPTFKTDGFGFVFPRSSPLVPDVSRAILEVTEGEILKKIENKWLGTTTNCPDPNTVQLISSNISLESFWGLFLIAGITSLFALAVYVAMFMYGERHIIFSSNTQAHEVSIRERIHQMFRVFDQKDLTSHTFKKSCELPHRRASGTVHVQVPLEEEAIANTSSQPSPFTSSSNHKDI